MVMYNIHDKLNKSIKPIMYAKFYLGTMFYQYANIFAFQYWTNIEFQHLTTVETRYTQYWCVGRK